MSIFNVLTLFGGLAMFLFGMSVMGDGLEKSAGNKLKTILARLTSSPLKGFFLGLVVTAVIQSSSATTVMVVGFVNSGVMTLRQAIGIIMGANVGTTATAWLLSLTGIQGDSFLMEMLKPSSFAPILAVIGIVLYMFTKGGRKRDVGAVMLGFSVLMVGMQTMSSAVEPLADAPWFTSLFTVFTNPIFGVLAGAALTAIIQSSSASVGILQALSATGAITFGSAIPIIMGQNIGTCATAMLSSVGTNKNARRAAIVHLYFNIIGTVIFLVLFYSLNAIFEFTFLSGAVDQVGIAIVHTIFNLLCTVTLLPFTTVLEKLACMTIKDDPEEINEFQLLDERLMITPPVAIDQAMTVAVRMSALARDAMVRAMDLVDEYDAEGAEYVLAIEEKIDTYEDRLGTYLVKLSTHSLSERDSREVSKMLHTIGDFERISDHACSTVKVAQEMHDKKITFSEQAKQELRVIGDALHEVLDLTTDCFARKDLTLAVQVEPLEQVIDHLKDQLKRRHISRLQDGLCTIELGFIFADLLTNYERVSDHCSNVAACMVEIDQGRVSTHRYLDEVKTGENSGFLASYDVYLKKYALQPK